MSFSSDACPCTSQLADSTRLWVAAATSRACGHAETRPQHVLPEIMEETSKQRPTFPAATSSLWAAEAARTRAEVAAVMDLAASRIISSKLRFSSALFTLLRGCRLASLRAAASMDDAAPSSSVSAITVGSSGSAQSFPARAASAAATMSVTAMAMLREEATRDCFPSLEGLCTTSSTICSSSR
ncbi:unnamed protein product [Ixodes hexagonus]